MKPLAAALVLLVSAPLLQAQTFEYTICDTMEVCICHDGSEAAYTYSFVPCEPGQVVSLAYCCGEFPEGTFITVFSGPSVASPVLGTFMQASSFGAQQFISIDPSGVLTLRMTVSPASAFSCTNGDYPPLVIGLYSGFPQPPPPPPIPPPVCPLDAACCLTTGLHAERRAMDRLFSVHDGALHSLSEPYSGVVELRDISGRLLEEQRWSGEKSRRIDATLIPGVYLIILRAESTESRMVVID